MLLKSCAMPPTSWPTASIFCAWTSWAWVSSSRPTCSWSSRTIRARSCAAASSCAKNATACRSCGRSCSEKIMKTCATPPPTTSGAIVTSRPPMMLARRLAVHRTCSGSIRSTKPTMSSVKTVSRSSTTRRKSSMSRVRSRKPSAGMPVSCSVARSSTGETKYCRKTTSPRSASTSQSTERRSPSSKACPATWTTASGSFGERWKASVARRSASSMWARRSDSWTSSSRCLDAALSSACIRSSRSSRPT